MLTETERDAIAGRLLQAYSERRQIERLTRTFPQIEIEDAYRIQEKCVATRVAGGARVCGYKVGLTSKAMQEQAGSSEPDYSALLDDMLILESSQISAADYFDPLLEIEIAFVMKADLRGPRVTVVDVIRATDFVLPAVELVDFRVRREKGLSVIDTVADMAACGAVILGANPVRLEAIDIRSVSGSLFRNAVAEESGSAAAVLGNPIAAVAWLCNKLAQFGAGFHAGQVVLSGSFVRAVPVRQGDCVLARFDSGLGDVSLFFR